MDGPMLSEGFLTSFLLGFGTNVTQFIDRKKGGNRQTFKHFNNKKNKHKIKEKRQPITDDYAHKTQNPGLVLSCFSLSCLLLLSFRSSSMGHESVSGAGVIHYHLLHRPRSVPMALGPAPLITIMLLEHPINIILRMFYPNL